MPTRARSLPKTIFALVVGLVLALVLLEIGCQAYALILYRKWAAVREQPEHFFTASTLPELAYEHARDYRITKDGRELRINGHGIRDSGDEVPEDARTVAILGDSVVFGIGLTQAETISSHLQTRLDPSGRRVRVLNFGVSGYALPELNAFLRHMSEVYDVDDVVFVLNANDFCRRGSVTEGSDNGLYRMYRRPWLTTPWMLRKLVYRLHKSGRPVSVEFYRWVYEREREHGFAEIRRLADFARERGIRLTVVVLPAGCAFGADGTYAMQDIQDEIVAFLRDEGIACIDPLSRFAEDPSRYFDPTDHLFADGNVVMATVIEEAFE